MISTKVQSYIEEVVEIKPELLLIFKKNDKIKIFDIGACTGEDSIRYSKLFPHASIYSFEPRQDNIEKFKELIDFYNVKNIEIVPLALTSSKGLATFYISSGRPSEGDPDWEFGNKSSSLLKPSPHSKQHFPWLEFNTIIEVETERLDFFCEVQSISSIEFIHLDVQGSELEVLHSAGKLLRKVKLIWLEVENVKFYEGQPLKKELDDFMTKNKFIKIKDTSIQRSYGDCLYLNRSVLTLPFILFSYLPYLIKKKFFQDKTA